MHYNIMKVLLNYIYVIHIINIFIVKNEIGDEGAIVIGNALLNNSSLTKLYLSNKYNKCYRW
jgi:hypothetical protein